MRYKAVIFDLDGTLLNTLDDLADSANHVLTVLGLPTHSTDSYRYFVGNGIPKLIERCLGEENLPYKKKALELFSKHYSVHSKDKTAPYNGIAELLKEINTLKIPMGVITNKSHPIAKEVVSCYFGDDVFACVRGLDSSIKAKPDPSGALTVVQELGVSARDVLYIGDSSVDMQTAKNAGFTPLGVLWGFRDKKELIDSGAVYTAEVPQDILEILTDKE